MCLQAQRQSESYHNICLLDGRRAVESICGTPKEVSPTPCVEAIGTRNVPYSTTILDFGSYSTVILSAMSLQLLGTEMLRSTASEIAVLKRTEIPAFASGGILVSEWF